MVFKDQLVRCAACGAEFVYTVREQRARAEAGLPLDSPPFCRECRGADVRLAEAAAPGGGSSAHEPKTVDPPGGGPRPRARTQSGDRRPRAETGRGRGRSGAGRSKAQAGSPRRRNQRQTELRFRYVGVVKWFDDDKAYGFIAADEGGEELFVHASAILAADVRTLFEGQPVEYEVERTARGLQAVDVTPLNY